MAPKLSAGVVLAVLWALLANAEASPVVGQYRTASHGYMRRRSANGSSTQLQNLTVFPGVLSPAFAPATLVYNVKVLPNAAILECTAIAASSTMDVSIQGHVAPGGTNEAPIMLSPNGTRFQVVVSDGTAYSTTYTITVMSYFITQLQNLTVFPGVLSPAFAPATLVYNVKVLPNATYLECTAIAASSTMDVSIQGHVAPGGTNEAPIMLSPNGTRFQVVVSDGTAYSTTYTITVMSYPPPSPAPGPSPPAPHSDDCGKTEQQLCGTARSSVPTCLRCVARHRQQLEAAGCTNGNVIEFCDDVGSSCQLAEEQLCGSARDNASVVCAMCCGEHQHELQESNCTQSDFLAFCKR